MSNQIRPSHYIKGGLECNDVIQAATTNLTGIESFMTGNVIKYIWRWDEKNGIEDLEKCKTYVELLIEKVKARG